MRSLARYDSQIYFLDKQGDLLLAEFDNVLSNKAMNPVILDHGLEDFILENPRKLWGLTLSGELKDISNGVKYVISQKEDECIYFTSIKLIESMLIVGGCEPEKKNLLWLIGLDGRVADRYEYEGGAAEGNRQMSRGQLG